MTKRLLDYDAESLTATYHHYDDLTNTTYIEEVQDYRPFLEWNKRIQNFGVGGAKRLNEYERHGIKKEWFHVARIPNSVSMKWLREEGIDIYNKNHWKKVKQKLNDPEYAFLRTGNARV